MISILFNLETKVAKVANAATIKVGADVPVQVVFSAAPGDLSALFFALGTDGAEPDVLAYVEDFETVNATTFVLLLDASDSRLADFMATKPATGVVAELVCVLDGERIVTPNLSVTVQPPIITNGTTSSGGGVGPFKRLVGVTDYTGGGATKLDGTATAGLSEGQWLAFNHATDGLRIYEVTFAATAESSPGFVRADDALGTIGFTLIN